MGPEPITGFFYGFERDKMTRAIPRGVDGVGRLLIVSQRRLVVMKEYVCFFYIFIYLRKLK